MSGEIVLGAASSGMGSVSVEIGITLMFWLTMLAVAVVSPWVARRYGGRLRARDLMDTPASVREVDGGVDVCVMMELLSSALKSGASVPRSLEACAEAVGGNEGLVLSQAGTRLTLGASWTQAWEGAAPWAATICEALRSAWEEGASPVDALAAASSEHRRTRRDAARAAAGQLGVRLVLPLGLCYLPAFVLIGLVPVLMALGVGLLGG
ncbi:MAG: type II secretion system F family protein [Cellulomonadaceae bacterium]|jgi:pilus assembly protein TadC|nr:type II secretion system F family protein [Cellulomonadaceae bacterium]